ncbi:unnamed protein product [Medioppia subpectinata]|uniref:Geranylgeranyl pyrophosphate synthase n=1 Tax=Medioppia subpectinata TaxID=1979941 RepID=A0A7R9KRZ2_9ACAR|nr:unnamed protein product [Medioppia subpectinata]CAG2108720.1 unnamed protein product [Medioppia subpectinata]
MAQKPIEEILLEPYHYLKASNGKQIRSKLLQAFNHWLQIPSDELSIVSEIVEMLHNASLLIDDIEDGSTLRRGRPVAHQVYGIPTTINSANYLYFVALQKIINAFPSHLLPKAMNLFSDKILEVHRGQGMDIYWRDSYICPTEEQYHEMVKQKSGALFALGFSLMQLFSDNKRDFEPFLNHFGAYFQIRDDLANLKSNEYTENKTFAEDLTEGKFSYPIVHAIQNYPHDSSLINILRQRTKNIELKKFAVNKLEELGSIDYTYEALRHFKREIMNDLQVIGGNPYIDQILAFLSFDFN